MVYKLALFQQNELDSPANFCIFILHFSRSLKPDRPNNALFPPNPNPQRHPLFLVASMLLEIIYQERTVRMIIPVVFSSSFLGETFM